MWARLGLRRDRAVSEMGLEKNKLLVLSMVPFQTLLFFFPKETSSHEVGVGIGFDLVVF